MNRAECHEYANQLLAMLTEDELTYVTQHPIEDYTLAGIDAGKDEALLIHDYIWPVLSETNKSPASPFCLYCQCCIRLLMLDFGKISHQSVLRWGRSTYEDETIEGAHVREIFANDIFIGYMWPCGLGAQHPVRVYRGNTLFSIARARTGVCRVAVDMPDHTQKYASVPAKLLKQAQEEQSVEPLRFTCWTRQLTAEHVAACEDSTVVGCVETYSTQCTAEQEATVKVEDKDNIQSPFMVASLKAMIAASKKDEVLRCMMPIIEEAMYKKWPELTTKKESNND